MPCGWGVKAGMIRVWVAGKPVWSPCYTRAISERFRDKELILKRYINSPSLLFLPFNNACFWTHCASTPVCEFLYIFLQRSLCLMRWNPLDCCCQSLGVFNTVFPTFTVGCTGCLPALTKFNIVNLWQQVVVAGLCELSELWSFSFSVWLFNLILSVPTANPYLRLIHLERV